MSPLSPARTRDERGIAFPSPLVMLSVAAVALAGIAFVATNDDAAAPQARQAAGSDEPAAARATPDKQASKPSQPTAEPKSEPTPESKRKPDPKPEPEPEPVEPAVNRSAVYVEVYNNSGISGLAGATAGTAAGAGWQVVGSDNWYGTIPASTVYYPDRLQEAATMLSRDLGISRTRPSIEPMRYDRLTVILTADYS